MQNVGISLNDLLSDNYCLEVLEIFFFTMIKLELKPQ